MSTLPHDYAVQTRTASGINILLGIWVIVSPWVFGYRAVGPAAIWNGVIVGALIAILAACRYLSPRARTGLSWVNMSLALWILICPVVYGYTANLGGVLDNVILGVAIASLAVWSEAASTAQQNQHPPRASAH
jgi:hypothetical protein